MEKFKNKYRTKSVRAPFWDYGWNATCFVTICTHNREYFFGEIKNGSMELSAIGHITNSCWHFDHSTGKSVKGINLLTAFYHSHHPNQELPIRIPVGFELVLKTLHFCELKTRKEKRKSERTKNEMLRDIVQ